MYDKAIELHQKAGELNADWKWGLGTSYARSGQTEKAMEVANELESRVSTWESFGLADIYSLLGKNDDAFHWLEIAYEQRHPWIQWIKRYRHFDALKDDPRFDDLARRLNLPD
jgi:tetratricopeptide (TPR) repeat protein